MRHWPRAATALERVVATVATEVRARPRTVRLLAAGAGIGLVASLLLLLAGREIAFRIVEAEAFVTPPPGAQTPDSLGAPSTAFAFASGDRTLRASFVAAPDARAPAILVFHGDEEELSRWAAVQQRLHAAGIASLVFDYSGYGASTGRPTLARLREDSHAAYARFVALTPQASRRLVLGFSLGAAVALDAAPQLRPPPDAWVVGAGFASAREIAVATGLAPAWVAWLLPDLWNNERAIARIEQPVLLIHSRRDEVVPFDHARRLCAAVTAPRRLVVLEAGAHDAPLVPAQAPAFWAAVDGLARTGALGAPAGCATASAGARDGGGSAPVLVKRAPLAGADGAPGR